MEFSSFQTLSLKGKVLSDQIIAPDHTVALDHPLIPAGRVNGSEVFNQAKEKIGRIEDLAIDKRSGKVAYAILSFGGFLGMGEKHQPLRWSMLKFDPALNGYVVPITEEFVRFAPKLRLNDLSGWDDSQDRDRFHSYYEPMGAVPYWEVPRTPTPSFLP
jgi:hypothetical protein